ncbi:catenin alpha-2 [Channa argus]|uniref:catenin alpha-2 n=1 Tax=Channa argus TaxID=215402 RepID=UPI003520E259
MTSLFGHGLIRTAAVEQVVAPIASHLCHLVLLCDSVEEPEHFSQLEKAAQAVAKATENMTAVASRQLALTEDAISHMEMSSLLESLTVSGQHVLLAAQKLSIQPTMVEHREELISATQNVFLSVVKVLIVDDDATVRRIVSAADQVLECLSELSSSSDMKSLLKSFQVFSEALLHLNSLTLERAHSLQDPRQTKQLLDSLETLRRCISMLHTAMCTTIKHPTSQQTQAAKTYILDRVQSTVSDIITTLKSECHSGPLGPCGYYTERRNNLLQLLNCFSGSSIQGSGFDSLVRDVVFHCIVVANSSRKEFQKTVVGHCRYILQFWSDIKKILKSSEDADDSELSLEKTGTLLMQQIQMLDKALMTTVLYQFLDTFLTASATSEDLVCATRQILDADSSTKMDLIFIQPLVEDFISCTDTIIQVANFISAVAVDAKSLESMENSRVCLARLREQIAPFSLELEDNSVQTVQKLHDMCQKWEEVTSQLYDAICDVMDVREITSIGIDEIITDRRGCDAAYREQSYKLFLEHVTSLICHMKLVIRSVRRNVDRSDNPIYRNGLLVLLKQAQSSQTKVAESARDMLLGSSLNVEVYSTFSDDVSTVIKHFKVLREGLDGKQHPHLLSPLREGARQPETSQSFLPVKDSCDLNWDQMIGGSDSPVLEVIQRDSHAEHEEEHSDEEIKEAVLTHKYDKNDLKIPAVSTVPNLIHKPFEFDLLPLLYEVVTVTKGKNVTVLNRACTGVLELSNCYSQATKEALAVADAIDCQTLQGFRAELVSLTPLLVLTAQETAMSSAMSTERIYKYSTQFSDLINNIRKVLLPLAGAWYHAVYSELQGNWQTVTATVPQQLNDVMTLCADVVQLLTLSDLPSRCEGQETLSVLHSKLNKAQNKTKNLVEFSTSLEGQVDQLEALCIHWGLSFQVLMNSLDLILGTSTAINLSPQKQLLMMSENSLRLQEAARLTSLNCKSAYKSKQLTGYQDELRTLTEAYLKAAEELDVMPNVMQLAKSEFLCRHLLIKIRILSGHLSKANKDYNVALQGIVSIAYFAAEHFKENNPEDPEQKFETAAQTLFENVRSATKSVEDCLNYIRDPRARSNLRSINDHLSFQISDIISRTRLMVETHYICDTLSLDVQIQCWSAKAHYVVEEIQKQEGIHQEAKEHIRAGLQGRTPEVVKVLATIPFKAKEMEFRSDATMTSWQKGATENVVTAESNVNVAAVATYGTGNMETDEGAGSGALKEASSLTYTSLFLKQKSDSWDPQDNRIVQVTRKMAETICYMTQYLKKKGPLLNKEAFVTAAKDIISNCQSVTQFIRVIANHCLDKHCAVELSLIVEQILTITNQLNIISRSEEPTHQLSMNIF